MSTPKPPLPDMAIDNLRFSEGWSIEIIQWDEYAGGILIRYRVDKAAGFVTITPTSEYRVAFFPAGETSPEWAMLCSQRRQDNSLSLEQATALRAYAKKNGRKWKAQLLRDWDDARVPEGPVLRQVRNIIGPSGLQNLNLEVGQ